MGTLIQDLRYGVRMLAKSPAFTLIAVLTLGIGIGANTALFSIVNGVLLNPLPYPNPSQLVALAETWPPFPDASISYSNFLDWQRMNHAFQSLATYRQASYNLTSAGEAQRLRASQVSATFFPLLGVNPLIGRNFSLDEDKQGAPPVVMLSGGLWKNQFGSSPEILGKTLTLDGIGYTVIGVVPENFYFCCESMNFRLGDIYVPVGAVNARWVTERSFHPGLRAVGRMKAGVSLAQARADMESVARDLSKAYPDTNKNISVVLSALQERMTRGVRSTLWVLLAAVGFVLLIACVNVANLLLARANGRAGEFAIRAVLGATQRRVIAQLLTESLLLAIGGGALGLLIASWGTQAGLKILPQALPRANNVRLDGSVLFFTLLVSLVAGIVFGLAPALKTSRPHLRETLKEGGRGASGARHRTQATFVVVELALAVVLLIGAGLMVRSLAHLWSVNPGFDAHNVLTFDVALSPSVARETPEQIRALLRRMPSAIAEIPGVRAASLTDGAEPMSGDNEEPFWIDGRPKPPTLNETPETLSYVVSPDYFKVMRIPLIRGRVFSSGDTAHSQFVAVIDDEFAHAYFPNDNPIGRRLRFGSMETPFEIVGVVGHVKQWGLDEDAFGPIKVQLYTLAEQMPDEEMAWMGRGASFVVRTETPNYASADAIRAAIQRMNSEQAAYGFEAIEQVISHSLASRRFAMALFGSFALVALVLAGIGIYGVMSYVAGQRTHEIGLRVALGAQRRDVLKLVLGEGARMALTGVSVGLAAAGALTHLIKSMLFGVRATDPLTFGGVAILLCVVAFAACYVPARRAMRVDPIVALRHE